MNINLTPNITGANVSLIKGATQADLTNAVNNSKFYRDESQAFSIVSKDKAIESASSALNSSASASNALIYRNEAESFANSINSSNIVHISGTETITGDKTFTGTISGLNKETVGLSNVDNTSDTNKPISNAVQTALYLKADKATTLDGYGINDAYTKTSTDSLIDINSKTAKTTLVDADEFMSADSTSSFSLKKLSWANLKATLFSSSVLTGIPTAPTASVGTNTTQIATTAFVKANVPAVVSASETTAGVIELATTAEAQAGTDDLRAITPLKLRNALNASGTAPIYACRAWVNFNGAGTVAIRASGNVSSITDNGTGDYTVNFTTAMTDVNYSIFTSSGRDNLSTNESITNYRPDGVLINYVKVFSQNRSSVLTDPLSFSVSIFR